MCVFAVMIGVLQIVAAGKKSGISLFDLPKYKGLIEIREEGDLPTPSEFYTTYASGFGKPFIMKGAAKNNAAFKKWQTDAEMAKLYPRAMFNQIEFAKQETRTADADSWSLKDFLQRYNGTDAYAVSQADKYMAADMDLPELLKCGYATNYLDVQNLWMSSGGADSVIHNDDQDNVNCVISGSKRFFMVDSRNKTHLENEQLGWTIASETRVGYGAFGGGNDVHNIDLTKHPRWADVPWYDAPVEAGDCIFIPTSWYHQVHSPAGRNIAFNIWWWRRDGPYDPEELDNWDNKCTHRNSKITLKDCQFGYEGPPDDPRTSFNPQRTTMTQCRGIPTEHARRDTDALAFITRWQRFAERSLFRELRRQGVDEFTAPLELQVAIMEKNHRRTMGLGDSNREL